MKKIFNILKFIHAHPLAGKHKVYSYYKFISWQLEQAFSPKQKIVPFIGKTVLAVNKGMSGATGNIYTGLHEFTDMVFLLHVLRKEDLFFDIGANIGSYTVLASGVCGASTIAAEPIQSTFKFLQKNIIINKIESIVVAKNIGLGELEGELFFTNSLDTVNHVLDEKEDISDKLKIAVKVLTVDVLIKQFGCPLLLKVDVEGFETPILNGMSSALQNRALKAIIIELNGSGARYGFDDNEIHLKLLAHNFISYQYEPFSRTLKIIDKPNFTNTIYLRDVEFIFERILTAEKINIFYETL